ncbi:uncharacterized protein PpBr36_06163 [Pyricularia pennisetigena]|uniref:uncharacterized protein n=1 Tax=Pyricularia pennisetigena TaxID=1578925 RepID=UPI0011516E5D|nr:uncharacterized protein PpBr36_06163 [Pyricularia pennisetigena]TLS22824.1 hypothetical protein PpBr36_06163 [Pyricularia pennisetigena]
MATDHNAAVAVSSSNPFRRRGHSSTASVHSPPPISVPDGLFAGFDTVSAPGASSNHGNYGSDIFKQQLQSLPKSAEAPPSTTFQRPKPVKKVRVQSPPPSSPESVNAEFEARFPAHGPPHIAYEVPGSDESSDDEQPLRGGHNYNPNDGAWNQNQAPGPARPPANPFSKTLSDLENTSADGKGATATTGAKGSMDVDAFRRLLMTGQPGAPHAPAGQQAQLQPPHHQGDAASNTDASSISRHSIFDASNLPPETPRTSHEISDEDEDEEHGLLPTQRSQRKTLRKKPPPPASRHGKPFSLDILGQDFAEDPGLSPSLRSSSASSDLNKPLPPAPRLPGGDANESVFDREAAGKIPEVDVDPDAPDDEIPPPRPPTPPNASHSTASLPLPKKPAAPPPRRPGHGRSDSRATVTSLASPVSAIQNSREDHEDGDSVRRPSSESVRSRSSSIRAPAPAPPPPRRSAATSNPPRPNNGLTSPGVSRTPTSPCSGYTWPGDSPTPRVSSGGAPPPPPARKNSVRSGRPASIRSVDSTSRRIDSNGSLTPTSSASAPPPPPPPPRPRARGGSRTSTDGVPDGTVPRVHEAVPEEVHIDDPGAGKDILADLDALQREVDALRGLR